MQITKAVEIAFPLAQVWDALGDIHLVADCLPGAALTEQLGDDRYKGRFQVKVGPLAAAFDGEVAVERRETEHAATISGKGADARSASRASGMMSYRLAPADDTGTRIEVESQVNLAGPLAQFGKLAVMQEVANRITAQFAQNLEARLAATPAAAVVSAPVMAAPAPSKPLDAGGLVWSILWDRVTQLIRRLFGRRPVQNR